ncbi:MAG: energy transducer TonB [Gemmatimonadaceae bacterium]
MIFRRLIERQSSLPWYVSAEGAAVSFVAHALVIGAWLVGTRDGVTFAEPAPTFSPAQYLIPKDHLIGSRPKQEQVTWMALAPTAPGAGLAQDPLGDKEKLEYLRPKGEQADEEKAPEIPVPQPEAQGDSVMTELQVDTVAVRYEDSAAPPYPETMLKKRIEGTVIVQYVVDTLGHADTASFQILFASHRDFAQSVKSTLPNMRFRAAVMGNQRVKQLVQQPFSFKIVDTLDVVRKKP